MELMVIFDIFSPLSISTTITITIKISPLSISITLSMTRQSSQDSIGRQEKQKQTHSHPAMIQILSENIALAKTSIINHLKYFHRKDGVGTCYK